MSTVIDLSQLPAPDVIETLDVEVILAEMIADLTAIAPELAEVVSLESTVAAKILQVCAYREVLVRNRCNDAARAVMSAYATGTDLDHLAALFGVTRFVIVEADSAAFPPVAEELESDADLRRRMQLAIEGFSTAGPRLAYVYHALSADADVLDASATSPTPGDVLITVLSRSGDGTADAGLLAVVLAATDADTVRPLTDTVAVQSATLVDYAVTATLTFYSGPDPTPIVATAQAAVQAYVDGQFRLGLDVTRSGLFAALHQAGVQNVTLTSPAADIVIDDTEAARCTGITVTMGGTDA